jgi:hypothetical protein
MFILKVDLLLEILCFGLNKVKFMKSISCPYINYLKIFVDLNLNIVIENPILELIMYIHTFQTRSLPCFNEFHQLYFKDGKKVIPSNIEELLTPVPLAYWAMDDGAKLSSGFLLCTHSFLLSDVELLTKVLKSKFDLDTSVYTNKKGHSSIYIKTSSMDKFRELVSKHFHVSMKYKLEP